MSSPQSYSPATSPPCPAPSQLPASKKRSSTGGDFPSSAKRRKPSTMSITSATSAHPLRQTSFPPEVQGSYSPNYERSPSVDTMSLVSGSQVSGAPGKKKRGRKSKAERARETADGGSAVRGGTPSVVGGPAGSVVSGAKADGGDNEDEDGGQDGGVGQDVLEAMASRSAARSKEQIEEEERLRALLKQRMTDDQFHRYEMWHQSKLTIASIRKCINSITSQSVQPSIPQAMQVVCKLFIGDIVEEARRVQGEWRAAGEKQTDLPDDKENEEGLSALSANSRQAPLRPDHFAEAYRRWKVSNISGGSGGNLLAWNQQARNGVERFAPRVRGRRLFK